MAYDTQLFTNNAVSLLAAPISASSTSLQVMAGYGQLFPNPGPGEYFLITLEDQSATVREIIKVTSRTGDTLHFTLADRGQEGTTLHSWSATLGNDTLVDHRITAETMRRAMLLPEQPVVPPAGIQGITVQDEGAPLSTLATTLNFTGAGVTVTGSGAAKTITIPGGGSSGTAWINGANEGPITVNSAENGVISAVQYSQFNRGFKFMVTIVMPPNGISESFELMANINGNIAADVETVKYTKYGRVGQKLNTVLTMVLDKPSNTLYLDLQNNEVLPIQVMCTRIQHST